MHESRNQGRSSPKGPVSREGNDLSMRITVHILEVYHEQAVRSLAKHAMENTGMSSKVANRYSPGTSLDGYPSGAELYKETVYS